MNFFGTAALVFTSAFANLAFASEYPPIQIISPYDASPFVENLTRQTGLIFDVTEQLNLRAKGKFKFKGHYIPRARLVMMLKTNPNIVIPFVSPKWFGDSQEQLFEWSVNVSKDCNTIIYRKEQPIDFTKMEDLTGMKTSVVIGEENPSIKELILSGKIKSESASTVAVNFLKLAKGRVDFIVTGRLIAEYAIAAHKIDNLLIAKKPVDEFDRKFLISRQSNPEAARWIQNTVKDFNSDGTFKRLFQKHQLTVQTKPCAER